ncbi:hypothetical protein [Vibrio gallaecicus]|uniref:Uncharacterized protein n=1 Tax=Vibrio gallaecicus TaxID=552386 RepID=A0ABV4NEQ5_9VIBR
MDYRIITSFIIMLLTLPNFSYAAYPNLAWTTFNESGTKVYDTNNVIKVAIEADRFIQLRNYQKFEANGSDIFKEINDIGQFELNAYVNSTLMNGISDVVGEFACATYRHYSKKPETRKCNESYGNKKVIEGMPFQDGQYISKRISVSVNHISTPSRSYDLYLPSANESPLSSFWGAAHELGSFFVRLDKESTVLKIFIDAYRLNSDGERTKKIVAKPQVIVIVIPSTSKIGNKNSESEAKIYAISNAQVLVPIYTH